MGLYDLLTSESVSAFRTAELIRFSTAEDVLTQYTALRDEHVKEYESLAVWSAAIENFDFAVASDPTVLASLARDDFFCEDDSPSSIGPDDAVFRFKLIAPRIVDAFETSGDMAVNYAFNSLHVRFCRSEVPRGLPIPKDWEQTTLVNCEIFELPYGVADDIFDDREKIHVYYLVGLRRNEFRAEPVYIGIGTGEAYGRGPASRTTRGRFRFYRYDIKDNYHFEYIAAKSLREWEQHNVSEIPSGTQIGEDTARLLLVRGPAETGFVCLADPVVADGYREWIKDNPQNDFVFRLIELRKVHEDLSPCCCEPPKPGARLDAALELAQDIHRYFFTAWQHPYLLTATESLRSYFQELPHFRRSQYEVYRLKPSIFGPGAQSDGVSIPTALFSPSHRAAIQAAAPDAMRQLEDWFNRQVVRDLYSFGNHPELRLCSALVLARLLISSGFWAKSIKATFNRRLHHVDHSVTTLTRTPREELQRE